ncbi:MAG TPA: hypothetical protein VEJ67_10790 [Candidatus Cybelea sp.]|nr:hypothetical protein [Candidatus Cybelea sp.]
MTHLPSPPQWQKLSEVVWKTDLGADRPEVVILQMPDDDFRRFHTSTAAAKNYLDKCRYLKRELIAVIFGEVVPQPGDGGVWTIVVTHTVKSTAVVVAWQNPK